MDSLTTFNAAPILNQIISVATGRTPDEVGYNVKDVICFDSENELARILNLLRNENYKNLCFAYEPNEEISTSNLIEQIDKFNEKLKVAYTNDYELLYGGNISSQNIEDFNKNLKVDGFLISRHALSIDELKTMIYLVNE